MTLKATNVEEYLKAVPEERQVYFNKLWKTILDNMPEGFESTFLYKMPAIVVPHSIYPDGYHCDPKTPLPFINIASQKNFIAFYSMGLYANKEILDWFVAEYPKHCKRKLDMGKSCIRFKKPEEIPFDLIAEVVQKISVADWINSYETQLKK